MKLPTTITHTAYGHVVDDQMAALEYEMRAEQAASLGRVGRKLENKIEELRQCRAQLTECKGPERVSLLEKCLRLHEEAERFFWYLQVQREAMGIYNHDQLRRSYPIPSATP